MHLLFSPVLASGIWIGGGAVGLLLVIIVVLLLLRRSAANRAGELGK